MIKPNIAPRKITGAAATGLFSAAKSSIRRMENVTKTISKSPSLTKEEKVKERMAALRAKRKPPKLKGVHPSVLQLPDDNTFSHKNIKKWIETQQV